jgi:AsmA protein
VRIGLLPLLRKRLRIERVEIEGLAVRLRKNAQGRGNWQGAESQSPAAAEDHSPAAPSLESLANIRVQGAQVSFADLAVENLDLETGSLAGGTLPLSVKFDAHRAPSALSLTAKFVLGEDAAHRLRISDLHASGTAGRVNGDQPAHWEFTAPVLNLDLGRQTAAAGAVTLNYASARLSGSIQAGNILEDLSVSGSLKLASLVPREFAPRLGIALPPMRDPKALTQFSASTDFAYDDEALAFTHLRLLVDDSTLQGNIKWLHGATPALQFELSADQIDFDRYRAPEHAAAPQSPAAPPEGSKPRPLELSGSFTLKAAHVARLDLTDVSVTVARKDQLLHLFPIAAQLDGGRYAGNISVDGRGPVPLLSVDEHLTGVDMARLLANTSGKGRLSGRATLSLKATARGADGTAALRTLNGQLDAKLADGALEGIDVGYEISQAQALLDKSSPPARADSGQTKFEAFKASAQITNGIAQTHDLTIASQALKVTGEGTANLATQAIDFKLLANILAARNTEIPLKVTGTYASPTVRPDVEALAKGQLKQKLQDILKKNGLRGLFK